MNEIRQILSDSVNGLLSDRVTREFLTEFDQTGSAGTLWQDLTDLGVTRPMVAEENGGVGCEWADALVLVKAAGYHAAPVPLAETIVATWLLEKAGLPVPDGAVTLGECADDAELMLNGDGKANGRLRRVAWADVAEHVVAVAETDDAPRLVCLPVSSAERTANENVAKEARDDLTFDGAAAQSAPLGDLSADIIRLLGGAIRAAQIAGAMERVLEQTVMYANERTQFGRPIGKFQAIQQELASMAGEAAASGVIAEAPFSALDRQEDPRWLIAAAKSRTSEAAGRGTSVSHQTHGAIGFTYEHELQFFTRRLWSWRSEFGTSTWWNKQLGEQVISRGTGNFWADITDR